MAENKLFSLLKDDKEALGFQKGLQLSADSIESMALAVSLAFSKEKQNIAVVLPSLYEARTFLSFLNQFISADDILFFPYDEVLRIEAVSSSKEMVKERLFAMANAIDKKKKSVFITNAVALVHQVSPQEKFKEAFFRLLKGQRIKPEEVIRKLESIGYSKVTKVEEVFQYAYRGEILDIFSPAKEDPYRIEYFDDVIDDIRLFSAQDEMSYKEISTADIIPGQENLLSAGEIEKGSEAIKSEVDALYKKDMEGNEELYEKTSAFLASVSEEGLNETQIRYLPYFLKGETSIFDYLSDFRILLYRMVDIQSVTDNYFLEAVSYFEELRKAHLALSQEMSCFRLEDVLNHVSYEPVLDEKSSLSVSSIPYHFISVMEASRMIKALILQGYALYLFISEEKYARFADVLKYNWDSLDYISNFHVVFGQDLSHGFLLSEYKTIILSEKEIYGTPEGASFFIKRFREAKMLTKYQDLTPGDYVVHEEEGIGIYRGIKTIEGLEYLAIEYEGVDHPKLYVPLDKYRLIRKYSGKDGLKPHLDKMGGATWARRKAKIRGRVAYLADKLLEIEAARAGLLGFSFKGDDALEAAFGNAFPYQLTLGQENAWKEIRQDMESPHPMDRLLAGDVGFGKTEIAFRAAYRSIISGKQAALLCPTTVLAHQHFEVATQRFNGFLVHIAVLSRNVTPSEQKTIIEGLKNGQIDFVIGTHRLLSDDIKFKDLGLLIVDEEQRFGVTHKEKIKEMSVNIDVLTLTATPIPRTLQMSLLNVRQLSLLSDPPINRLPIKTYVVKYDKMMIKEVISRELGRGGQVYYLHNRVQTIYKTADDLQKLFPSAHIGVAHGQLDAEDMGQIMDDFYKAKIDILVCTTIIETGLDVANCNTIIIEKAENFGLAQLYQIKGRVGRSSRLAYAYLTYPDYSVLNDDSKKRLKALKDFTELGSGYKIASQDLNIRGAGDILGKEQAGFIDSIGYEAYMKLLKEVMEEKTLQDKGKKEKSSLRFSLSFSLDSHIPSDYATEADRINIYRELYDITTRDDLLQFEKKIKDVYGHFGPEMKSLFLKKEVEIMLDDPIVSSFKEYIDRYDIKMSQDYSQSAGMAKKISRALEKYDHRKIQPRYAASRLSIFLIKSADYLIDLYDLVSTLLKLYYPCYAV